jgi:hypothetical protein
LEFELLVVPSNFIIGFFILELFLLPSSLIGSRNTLLTLGGLVVSAFIELFLTAWLIVETWLISKASVSCNCFIEQKVIELLIH